MHDREKRRLQAVYGLFDNQIQTVATGHGLEFFCKERCSSCCTCNVTLTRLETLYLIQLIPEDREKTLLETIRQASDKKRYLPGMTFNRYARLCSEGGPVPDEENNPFWGPCMLLENDLCRFYANRPFGCRALVSTLDCRTNGYARIDPYVLTLNHLFLQYIEHMDPDGFSGNLTDMLGLLLPDKKGAVDFNGADLSADGRFVKNEPVRMLMVPPEHRKKVRPVLEQLNAILSGSF